MHWVIKQEPIAKKRYKAYMKLKKKQNVIVEDMGLVLCAQCSYIGASPDGLVKSDTNRYLFGSKVSLLMETKHNFRSLQGQNILLLC